MMRILKDSLLPCRDSGNEKRRQEYHPCRPVISDQDFSLQGCGP